MKFLQVRVDDHFRNLIKTFAFQCGSCIVLLKAAHTTQGIKMTTKLKKGTQVYYFINWNSKGTFVFRACTVKSCGVKQMTLESEEDGQMIKSFVYAGNYHAVVAVADIADPAEYAEQLATKFCVERIAFYKEHRVGNEVYNQAAILAEIEAMTNAVYRGISYEQACAELKR